MPEHHCSLCHIEIDGLSVSRGGQTLLHDVSMHIHCGQLTVLIGQNGAGRTTLIRALLGELPHGGVIRHVDDHGRDIPHLRTGYVPQHLLFDREMPVTVEDFLAAAFTRRPVWTGVSRKTRARPLSGAARGLCRPTKTGGISSAGSAFLSFIRGSGTARRPLPCARSR